jgi:hypothetical protein
LWVDDTRVKSLYETRPYIYEVHGMPEGAGEIFYATICMDEQKRFLGVRGKIDIVIAPTLHFLTRRIISAAHEACIEGTGRVLEEQHGTFHWFSLSYTDS